MKQNLFSACTATLLGVVMTLFPISSFAASVHGTDGDGIILIRQQSDDPIGYPRMPSATRIEASIDTDLCVVDVWLYEAGPYVTVDIVNTSTNDSYQYIVLGSGSDILPISSVPGMWTITFTLADGDVYYGVFVL
jgi:hypothetical protein